MIIQFCGLSGSGKTTLSGTVQGLLKEKNIAAEILDGDEYRRSLFADLGFSREDRIYNIRRLAFLAARFSAHNIVSIISAINPFEDTRQEVALAYPRVKTVFIDCSMAELMRRDTKGLYRKAMLPVDHPEKIFNLTGVNDPFEPPHNPDLIINTGNESIEVSAGKLLQFILLHYEKR
jgi:adenylylsulfate kinase